MADDNTVITVYEPVGDFITGGGHIIPVSSAGSYAADAGSKTNFGFNVKYNNKGTNLQGHVNVIIRRTVGGVRKLYQIKANNLGTLSVSYCKAATSGGTPTNCGATPPSGCTTNATSTCPIKSTFTAQANIQDVTNPYVIPLTVESGVTVELDLIDYGE